MALLPIVILALVQGITEFLPVSSSSHLILVRFVMTETGLQATQFTAHQELALDVAVHVGTLVAAALYFRLDIAKVITGCLDLAQARNSASARLALHLLVASIPVALVGFFAQDLIENFIRDRDIVVLVIALTTIGFALVLYGADRAGEKREVAAMNIRGALIVGLAQVLALIPGTSRAGITISAARLLGLTRTEAARFSFLLSIPAIAGAGLLLGRDVVQAGDIAFGGDIALALIGSFIAAYAAIALLMRWLAHASFTPFVVYRILLGGGLLILFWLI